MKPLCLFAFACLFAVSGRAELEWKRDGRVLLYGNSFVERLQEHGLFEACVQMALVEKRPEFRSLAWTGDEVGHRLRPERYVNHLKVLLEKWPADVVLLGFGLNESFAGEAGLPKFRADLTGYLDEMERRHPEAALVLLSPVATEDTGNPLHPHPVERNEEIRAYAEAMRQVAEERKLRFIDLFAPTLAAYAEAEKPLTSNGIHLNGSGYDFVAPFLARKLLGESAYAKVADELERAGEVARAVSRKAGHVADVVRPVNTVLYFGVRGRRNEYDAEMPRFHAQIEKADEAIHALCANPSLAYADEPVTLPPLVKREPGPVPSPEEALAQFKVADGYEVNLFASERDFPELRNPEQIAFDGRGRLWVVTMPSFPGTIPGDVPQDKILVLEDTDRDGRADKSTVFADGLTVPDGIAFHKDGVIVSHQPRLLFMKDLDGDGRADLRREILRGIDVTDAHHGGMIAVSPLGHVLFCDGVFHRSQLETPAGVVRGVDATTYRLDPRSGSIVREYQTLTPNPWKITWDRRGNLFQMYGDGFVQDGHAVPWTPFGVYHPFKRAVSVAYGKGSAAAVISGPNFPAEYQQGMASAVLLRKCFVSISKHKADGAYFRASDRLDLLSSPNTIFRPVDLAFGFDGALYVSDFCSRIIGHAQNSMRDPRWDPQFGRIWRIRRKDGPTPKEWPEVEGASAPELLDLLAHPHDLARDHARRRLRHLGGVVPTVESFLAKKKVSDDHLLEILRVLHGRGETRQPLLERLLASEDPSIRAAATHLIRFQVEHLSDPFALLGKRAKDPHPRVRTEVMHVASHLQRKDPAYASLLGQVEVSDDKSLQTILADASHGVASGQGPEIPVLEKPEAAKLTQWFLREGDAPERPYLFGSKAGSLGTLRTFVRSPAARRAILSIRHSYVKVFLNDVPVVSSANWWSSDWNVQVDLPAGLSQIEVRYLAGRGRRGYAPLYLFDPLGNVFPDLDLPRDEDALRSMAAAHRKARGSDGASLRVTAVPNQLAFSPKEIRMPAGHTVKLTFDNPDHQIHNLVLVRPGTENEVGLLADQMAQDPDAPARHYVPASDAVLFSTPLVNARQKVSLSFTAPATPGRYPYLCTFPGHWRVMKGVLVVE